jgi:hypothetical protein
MDLLTPRHKRAVKQTRTNSLVNFKKDRWPGVILAIFTCHLLQYFHGKTLLLLFLYERGEVD